MVLYFPFIMASQNCYIFFILSCWSLYCYHVLSLMFFGSLMNDIFSNLKVIIFIITGFVCSNKYVKQVVLINYSWISPTGIRVLFFLRKMGRVRFRPKKGSGWWNSSGRFLRESNLWSLLIFVFRNIRNITIQGTYRSCRF